MKRLVGNAYLVGIGEGERDLQLIVAFAEPGAQSTRQLQSSVLTDLLIMDGGQRENHLELVQSHYRHVRPGKEEGGTHYCILPSSLLNYPPGDRRSERCVPTSQRH